MEITGKIKKVFDKVIVSDKFQKREFVVTDNSQYPQEILMQLTQERCDKIELKEGQEVRCHINLRGREWTNKEGVVKYFNTIECWKIEEVQTEREPEQAEPLGKEDDLPF